MFERSNNDFLLANGKTINMPDIEGNSVAGVVLKFFFRQGRHLDLIFVLLYHSTTLSLTSLCIVYSQKKFINTCFNGQLSREYAILPKSMQTKNQDLSK